MLAPTPKTKSIAKIAVKYLLTIDRFINPPAAKNVEAGTRRLTLKTDGHVAQKISNLVLRIALTLDRTKNCAFFEISAD